VQYYSTDSEELAQHPYIEQLHRRIQFAQRETKKAKADLNDVYQELATNEVSATEQLDKQLKRIRNFEKEKTDQTALTSQMADEMHSRRQALTGLNKNFGLSRNDLATAKQDCEGQRGYRMKLEIERASGGSQTSSRNIPIHGRAMQTQPRGKEGLQKGS